MQYIISDIHGCYEQYIQLLERIDFSDEDVLYVLGDAMDRGPESIKVMQDIMSRQNVVYILGNHDFVILNLMQKLYIAHTSEEAQKERLLRQVEEYLIMSPNGEATTLMQFSELEREEQKAIMDYLLESYVYKEISYNGKNYLLVHAGIEDFNPDKELWEYDPDCFLFDRPDFTKPYFPDENICVVVGHTPTPLIREDKKPLIYRENGFLAIDCGCVFGGQLAAFCIETEEITYVDGYKRKK